MALLPSSKRKRSGGAARNVVALYVSIGATVMIVAEMYYNAAESEAIYSLLVFKNGHLIAERYFNEGSVEQKARLQSATESYTSAPGLAFRVLGLHFLLSQVSPDKGIHGAIRIDNTIPDKGLHFIFHSYFR